MRARQAGARWRQAGVGAVTVGALVAVLVTALPARATDALSVTAGPTSGGTEVELTMDRLQQEVLYLGGELGVSALLADGSVVSWGDNSQGQSGAGFISDVITSPVPVAFPEDVTITELAQAGQFAVAVDDQGRLWSWGANTHGYLGTGQPTGVKQTTPGLVAVAGDPVFTEVSASAESAYAITEDGQLYGWGMTKLADPSRSSVPVPIRLPGGAEAAQVQTSSTHVVVLTTAGDLVGWGTSSYGQLGTLTGTVPAPTVIPVSPSAAPGARWSGRFTVANYTLYAQATDGFWYARGYNSGTWNGSILGGPCVDMVCAVDGVRVESPAGVDFVDVGPGAALDSEGDVWTWGPGSLGRRGDGQTSGWTVLPTKVDGLSGVSRLWTFPYSMMALASDNSVYGWGSTVRQGYPATSVPAHLAGFGTGTISSVTFDGVEASLTGATAGAVTVTTPPHPAGVVDVVVTWTDGGSRTFEDGFTYGTAPAVTTHPASTQVEVGSAASFSAAASGDELPTVQWQRRPAGGDWADLPGGTTPTLDVSAADSVDGDSYRAIFTNGLGSVTTSAAVLTVHSALAAEDDLFTVPASGATELDVLLNDLGDGLTLTSLTTATGGGTATIIGDRVSFTPAVGSATDSFTYTVTDAASRTATATVMVTVQAAPVAQPVSAKVSVDEVAVLDPLVIASGNALVLTAGTPSAGNAAVVDGRLELTPDQGWTGVAQVPFAVTDDLGQSASGTATVTVQGRPIAADDAAKTRPETTVDIPVLLNDTVPFAAGTEISAQAPAHGVTAVDGAAGTIAYTPEAGWLGEDSFVYTLTDDLGASSSATVTVRTVAGPAANDDHGEGAFQASITVDVLANDQGAGLRVVDVTSPMFGSVTRSHDGTLVYTPTADFSGTDSFVYTVMDADGETDAASVLVTSYAVPVVSDQRVRTAMGQEVVLEVQPDALADAARLAPVYAPIVDLVAEVEATNGQTSVEDLKILHYLPNADYSGGDEIIVALTDRVGQVVRAKVDVTVQAAPAGVDLAVATERDTPVTVDVRPNVSGEGVKLSASARSAHGTVVVTPEGALTYTPDAGYVGADSVRVVLADDMAQAGALTVMVSVTTSGTASSGAGGPGLDAASGPGGGLASTGAAVAGVLGIASVLVASGFVLVALRRRRAQQPG